MPLVRFPLRNEYGLGKPELYKEADKECPKAVLDGVAVAGLVGILRQLGDLAEFAAEVFHGLQERVMTTASRSHRLKDRVKNIEAALPSLEKAVLRQTSHIHFAYTAGCEWHPHIKNERNHFISNDLPEFIMDSYEECRDPPNLHLLDKFDMGGPGSCLKRYSDPTFFKKISAEKCVEVVPVKAQRNMKTRKNRKRRYCRSNQALLHHEPTYSGSVRMKIISAVNEQPSPSDTFSTIDNTTKSDLGEFRNSFYSRKRSLQMNGEVLHKPAGNGSQRTVFDSEFYGKTSPSYTSSTVDTTPKSDPLDDSHSFGSRAGAGFIECVFHPSVSIQTAGKSTQSFSLLELNGDHNLVPCVVNDNLPCVCPEKQVPSSSSSVTLDEKEEILNNAGQQVDRADSPLAFTAKENLNIVEEAALYANYMKDTSAVSNEESILKSVSALCSADEIDSEPENFMDALNTIESESENDSDCQIKQVEHLFSKFNSGGIIEMAHNMKKLELPNLGSYTAPHVSSSTSEDQNLSDSVHEFPLNVPEQSSPKCSPFTVSHDNLNEESPNSLPENHATEVTAHNHVPEIKENFVSDSVHEFPPDTPEQLSHTSVAFAVSRDNLNEQISNTLPDKHAVEITAHNQVPHVIENSVSGSVGDTDSSCNTVKSDDSNLDSQNTETTCSGSNVSNLLDNSGDGVTTFTNESKEFPVSFSNGSQVSFWTNGGLLGLEPSKPPTFAISSSTSQGSLGQMKREMLDVQNHNATVNCENKAKFDMFGKEDTNYGWPSSHYISPDNQISHKRASSISSSADAFSSLNYPQNSFPQVSGGNLDENKITAPGTALPVAPDMRANSLETNFSSDTDQGVSVNSSVVFGLSHRLLMSGLYRKVIGNDKPETATSGGICEEDQNGLQGIANQHSPKSTVNEKFVQTSIIESPTLSPPLEHMKISFQPINRLEASKLQLKFPDVNHSHASARDMFPSFKLVPEPGVSLHGSGSNSDEDDTFCRSSPYGSDDCLSQNSGCDSDQWECIETEKQGIDDHVEYCSSHRITSTESSSSSLDLKGSSSPGIDNGHNKDNRLGSSPNGPLLNFPSFDTMDSFLMQESKENLISKKPERKAETEPVPPPLPPMQWCTSKSLSDVTESKTSKLSEDIDLVNDQRLVEQSCTQQDELPLTMKKRNFEEELAHVVKERLDRQPLDWQTEANHVHNSRTMDVKEDFLHQIRTRSFNLRRTVPTKSNVTTGPVASVNVTAILEKASAIRQAVASDDGEDEDNWSDT